jgi:putative ATPase
VPIHLRDTSYFGAEKLGHKGYQYSHGFEGGWVDQQYLSEDRRYYEPTDRGYEAVIRERLEDIRAKRDSDSKGIENKESGKAES